MLKPEPWLVAILEPPCQSVIGEKSMKTSTVTPEVLQDAPKM